MTYETVFTVIKKTYFSNEKQKKIIETRLVYEACGIFHCWNDVTRHDKIVYTLLLKKTRFGFNVPARILSCLCAYFAAFDLLHFSFHLYFLPRPYRAYILNIYYLCFRISFFFFVFIVTVVVQDFNFKL